jgi:hypothetical protein
MTFRGKRAKLLARCKPRLHAFGLITCTCFVCYTTCEHPRLHCSPKSNASKNIGNDMQERYFVLHVSPLRTSKQRCRGNVVGYGIVQEVEEEEEMEVGKLSKTRSVPTQDTKR